MLRLLLMLTASGCGGFNTPPQQVAIGLALGTPNLPPRLAADGHVLELRQLEVTLAATVEDDEAERQIQAAHPVTVGLTQRWLELARGELPRGEYRKVRLFVSALAVSGTFDGSNFRVVATEGGTVELPCDNWRVELGKASSVSLLGNPVMWMAKQESGQLSPLEPADPEAASELFGRFKESLKAVRDDDRDGAADPSASGG